MIGSTFSLALFIPADQEEACPRTTGLERARQAPLPLQVSHHSSLLRRALSRFVDAYRAVAYCSELVPMDVVPGELSRLGNENAGSEVEQHAHSSLVLFIKDSNSSPCPNSRDR
jgi:hypothetical protein